MKTLLLLFTILFSLPSYASDEFSIDQWEPGVHLFAGGGINSALYSSKFERTQAGVGLSFKTDLIYFIDENWGLDAGSSVKFNRIAGYLLWDTQLTLGARYNLQNLGMGPVKSPYVRAFIGRSPTVVFTEGGDEHINTHEHDVNRLQYDGAVYGLTLGNLSKTDKGTTWFTEVSFSYQSIDRASEIKMDGEVPVVVHDGPAEPNAKIYSITISIGALIF